MQGESAKDGERKGWRDISKLGRMGRLDICRHKFVALTEQDDVGYGVCLRFLSLLAVSSFILRVKGLCHHRATCPDHVALWSSCTYLELHATCIRSRKEL